MAADGSNQSSMSAGCEITFGEKLGEKLTPARGRPRKISLRIVSGSQFLVFTQGNLQRPSKTHHQPKTLGPEAVYYKFMVPRAKANAVSMSRNLETA